MELPAWAGSLWGFVGTVAGSSVIGSCLGAWLSMRFAYRRFRSERWWEKKAETYQKLVGYLTDIYLGLEEDVEYIGDLPDEPPTPEDRLREKEGVRRFREAKEALRRILIEGFALLSPTAKDIIMAFFKEYERRIEDEDPYHEFMRCAAAAKNAAMKLQEEMKAQLGVT